MLNFKNIFLSVATLCVTSTASAECISGIDFFEEPELEVVAEVTEIAAEPVQETVAETAVMVDTASTDVDDFAYVEAVHRRTANYDYRSVETDNGQRVLLETAPNSGLEIGVNAGVDYFNTMITPTVGAELGYHGKRFSFAASANIGMSEYNKESAKAGEKYMMTNFNFEAGLRLFDLPSKYLHQKEVWLIGNFGYKVRKNYNAFTDDAHDGALNFKVKGSTMIFGGGVRVDFKNYMKRSNFYVKAIAYAGHEYFFDGSEVRFGASATLGFNFVLGKKTQNTSAINKLFGSKSAYKKALKAKRAIANY